MKDCPELREIARFVETGEGPRELIDHLKACDACQEARDNLEDEVTSLQISISELWFREGISCIDGAALKRYAARQLPPDEHEYVAFHLETLECRPCQARLGELESAATSEGRRRITQSRTRVADATTKLLGSLRKQDRK